MLKSALLVPEHKYKLFLASMLKINVEIGKLSLKSQTQCCF